MLGKYRQNAPENKNRPAEGGAVDKTVWVRYTIDEKGTTSKAVPQYGFREVTETGEFGGYFSLLFAWFTRAITVAITMQN